MVLKGVKATFSGGTVTTWAYPSKAGYTYKLTKKTWKNKCPFCGGTFKFNPKKTPEGELTCSKCDADFCAVSGKDKAYKVRKTLTPATVTPNKATKVASSQTKSQQCELSKAEALTRAKKLINTNDSFKASLKVPVMKNIHLGDLVNINLAEFPETSKKNLYIDSIKEDIDNQTYNIELIEGKNHLTNKYEGNYSLLNKNKQLIATNNSNPLNAKCTNINMNIGLKDSSAIGKKIKLKGQQLGTVNKIYKWLRVKNAGGVGGWKYKKWGNHYYKSETKMKFGPKSAEYCWKHKTANCVDFAWIMAKMGEGAGKKIGIRRGYYTKPTGETSGHQWNYYGSKWYDCSSATSRTIEMKMVEKIK